VGALSEHGRLGIVAIGDERAQARAIYERTLAVLDRETGASGRPAKNTSAG
jgi:hypothetical protein